MTLDDQLRGRLAEIRAAAGVPHAQISLEVLYFLPKGFVDNYAELFSVALTSDNGESGRGATAERDGELNKATTPGNRGGAKVNGKKWKRRAFFIRDERMLEVKTRVDKKLRALGREIEVEMAGAAEAKEVLQCVGCRMVMAASWKYCCRCGKKRE